MNVLISKLFILFSFCLIFENVFSQKIDSSFNTNISSKISPSKFIVSDIIISGNRNTRKYLILREMRINVGDSIEPSEIHRKLSESKDLIYNSTLFSIVELSPIFKDSNKVVIKVNLIERWYIYPSPVFKLADRNFNEWYKTNHANLDRVTYGVKFSHNNLTGRGDNLDIFLL